MLTPVKPRRGRPKKVVEPVSEPVAELVQEPTVKVKVICDNLWTSAGKFLKLETAMLPRSEAEWLEGRDQVVVMG